MSNLTAKQHQLGQGWKAVHAGAGQAIEWIESVRGNAPRLDSEADNLILELHKARNLASSLGRAAGTPMTIGFFGLSQAGKSYLISAMAAGHNGKLETDYGGKRLDFIEHVNPVGGGKEATGLVTRFSRTAISGPADSPVELRLFSEVEIAKILANAWFNDFDHEQLHYELDEARIERILRPFEGVDITADEQPGLSGDDVVSLWDYLTGSFKKSISKLEARYWPRVLKLAPRLSCEQRADLFSLLWGEQEELTRLYVQLASTLRRLGNASTVYAPLTCLVTPEGEGYSQRDSIMNVDILERLGSVNDHSLEVRPVEQEAPGKAVAVSVAQLAALTAELTFPLIEPTQDPHVEKVDLLDFPGYRGRLSLKSVTEAASQASSEGGNPVSQLVLRGKVAYLFERYTDSQEMNALVVCTSSDKQSDVTSVGPVLTRWIEKTQGVTSQDRAGKAPGLIWTLTMFDKRISGALNLTESQLREGWEGLIKMTLLERFGQYDWMSQWAPGEPFNNTFLVRKPRLPVPFLDSRDNEELSINDDCAAPLMRMASTFAENASVQKHVHAPDEAWEAMLALNDGGIKRISQYLGRIATLDFKLASIEKQLNETLATLIEKRLAPLHHTDGSGEVAKKREAAKLLWQSLGQRLATLGELQHQLELPQQTVRDLYLSDSEEDEVSSTEGEGDNEEAKTADSLYCNSGFSLNDDPFSAGSPFDDIAATTPATNNAPVLQGADHRFARKVFQAWIAHLREIPGRQALLQLLGLEKEVVESLTDELITAANRMELQQRLDQALLRRAQSSAKRDQLVERQVLAAQLVLRDFIAWLGYQEMPVEQRPNGLAGQKDKLFLPSTHILPGDLPNLAPQPVNQAVLYLIDWLSGICILTQENAGHTAGREITMEQNERLGSVLTTFRQPEVTHAG